MNEVNALKDKKQIEKIRRELKGNPRDFLLFELGINIGLRISDLLQLKLVDIVDEKGRVRESISVREQKTEKHRNIRFNNNVRKAINDYMKEVKPELDSYLFASRKGDNKPISRVQAYRILNDAAKRAKIDGMIGTHTLRKTFGFWAYQQGIDITLLMQIFNHSAPSITLRYIGITQDEIDNVYLVLDI